MPRTYPDRRPWPLQGHGHALALITASAVAAAGIPLAAASLFDSRPLDQDRFAVLAQAVGTNRWKLLMLEQIKAKPLCWEERRDGLVTPSLNSFDFTGICSRYLDSNGYSLRTAGSDMASSFRLRLDTDQQGLKLSAMDPDRGVPIVVARAERPARNRNAFVKLKLEPGWNLERRAYQGRTLSHVYFAKAEKILYTLNTVEPITRSAEATIPQQVIQFQVDPQTRPRSRLPPLTPAAERVLLAVLLAAVAHPLVPERVVAVAPHVLLEGAVGEKDEPVGRGRQG